MVFKLDKCVKSPKWGDARPGWGGGGGGHCSYLYNLGNKEDKRLGTPDLESI